jgi:signal transduction histidine kinase
MLQSLNTPEEWPACPPGDGLTEAGADERPARTDRKPLLAAHWPRLCHDLRTPLNAILGNAELLLDGSAGPLSSEARACVGDIQAAGDRILRQVQALLDLCRARTAPASSAGVPLELLALLRAQATALEVPVAMQVTPADARLVVQGDAAWLSTLVAALLELRGGAAPRGGPLRVTLERPAAGGAGAVLCLSWVDFRPDQLAALPIALIDAILDLHEGMVALPADGLRLYWPASRLVQLEPCALLLAPPRKSV